MGLGLFTQSIKKYDFLFSTKTKIERNIEIISNSDNTCNTKIPTFLFPFRNNKNGLKPRVLIIKT